MISEGENNSESNSSLTPELSQGSSNNIGKLISSNIHTFDKCPLSHSQAW